MMGLALAALITHHFFGALSYGNGFPHRNSGWLHNSAPVDLA
jgi:hypothetical protein